jgi:hypothetical protein
VLAHIRADETGEYEDLFSRFSIRCAFIPAGSPMARRLTADGWRHRYEGLGFIVLARDGSASNQPAAALQGIPLPRYAASGSRP